MKKILLTLTLFSVWGAFGGKKDPMNILAERRAVTYRVCDKGTFKQKKRTLDCTIKKMWLSEQKLVENRRYADADQVKVFRIACQNLLFELEEDKTYGQAKQELINRD